MLREAGYKEEDGSEPKDDEDLTTSAERRLGSLVKDRFGADYYILGQSSLPSPCALLLLLLEPVERLCAGVSNLRRSVLTKCPVLFMYRQIPAVCPPVLHHA